jgi:cyclopropane fatty-acyl-phospholipid synthase-like methyltransferase
MQTMDAVTSTPQGALASPAAARNAEAIRAVLAAHLPSTGRVLEIAAGSGQHAVAFATAFPNLDWTPSDPSAEARASIAAWSAAAEPANLKPALALDVLDPESWPVGPFDAVVCINMIHISPWAATEALIALAETRLPVGGMLYLYGPYREAETPLAPSNTDFDASLKARDPDWGLREVAAVTDLASQHSLRLLERVEMPANNLSLIYERT